MNDMVRLAMERAVRAYGDKGDGLFNSASFSIALTKMAGLESSTVDGHLVRVILAGRSDVQPVGARGDYYRLLPE